MYEEKGLAFPSKIIALIFTIFILASNIGLHQTTAMRIVVQRVKSASVTVEGNKISSIGPGILALVGLHENDTTEDVSYCCKRLLGCKLWSNDGGMWRNGVKTKGYEVLCVSQFTLYGTLSKKHQPDYKLAMKAVPAEALYNQFLDMLKDSYEMEKIKDGKFGAMMDVELVNDGPVTIIIESAPKPSDEEKEFS
jgi:D-tyrosyl-tRNA(Tyr) deacylase